MLFPDKKWQFSRMFLENFWFQTDSSNTLIQLQERIMRRIRGYVKVCGVKSGWACKRTSQVFCRYILTVVGRIIRNSWANGEAFQRCRKTFQSSQVESCRIFGPIRFIWVSFCRHSCMNREWVGMDVGVHNTFNILCLETMTSKWTWCHIERFVLNCNISHNMGWSKTWPTL